MADGQNNSVGAVATEESASQQIDAKLRKLTDWRGDILGSVRRLIREADPDVVEEIKWRKPTNPAGVPTWCHDGILCTSEVYRDKIKLTFAKGAALNDPSCLFNSSLDGGLRRAIDIRQDAFIDEAAFRALIKAAVAQNRKKP